MAENKLYYGDNLDILRRYIQDESVDLVYLDPPFKSNQDYNVLFREQNGSRSKAQIKAFEDTWRWDREAAEAYEEVVEKGPERVSRAMQAFRTLLGDNDMLAYLSMMAPRLLELRRVLKNTGSIYLHCDTTASAHLRLLMDAVFSPACFRNEIVWQKIRIEKAQSAQFGRLHDVIFFYSKSDRYVFNQQRMPPSEEYVRRYYTKTEPDTRRRYQLISFLQGGHGPPRRFGERVLSPPEGKHWIWSQQRINEAVRQGRLVFTDPDKPRLKRYLDEYRGRNVGTIWSDIYPINAVAQRLKRRWIGIDITHLAITLIKHRLRDAFGRRVAYDVVGEPVSVPDAEALAKQDPYQFQWWALGLVGARPAEQKKGADRGIDGRLYFHDEAKGGKTKQIVLQVKAGHVAVAHVRDLRGVVDREKANIGVLIALEEPTQAMRTEAASGGFYESPGWGKRYPRVQILTIAELLSGKGIDYPPSREVNVTFNKAPRANSEEEEQAPLPGLE